MASAAYAWMPPQLSVALMGMDAQRPDFGGAMQRQWTLTQELPFPGRTWAQGRVATHQAEAMRADADRVERQELREARQAYFSLAGAETLLVALDTAGEATHEMARLSRRRASFGQLDRMGQFMDAMLAMEDAKVDALRPVAGQERRDAEATLKRLMGADPIGTLPPARLDLHAQLDEPLPSLEQALASAERGSPDLAMASAKQAAAQAAQGLALSGWLPDLMVQGSLSEDSQGVRQSGAMLGVSLPWLWFWKQAGEASAAGFAADRAQQDLAAARLALREQVIQALGGLKALSAALRITADQVAPKADLGLALARSGFRSAAMGPTEILMAVQDYRMTQQDLAQQIAQWGAAKALLLSLCAPAAAPSPFDGAKP
jgi:outer membrane protein TolC